MAETPNKHVATVLNAVSGLALLAAAAWFSYNMFSIRDTNAKLQNTVVEHTITDEARKRPFGCDQTYVNAKGEDTGECN